jgi:hypothetical protein
MERCRAFVCTAQSKFPHLSASLFPLAPIAAPTCIRRGIREAFLLSEPGYGVLPLAGTAFGLPTGTSAPP